MSQYRIIPISEDIADKVRSTLHSPQYGHPAHIESATGHGPCRSCLRTFVERQEDRILFTYNTFSGTDITPLPGPVYIHHKSCSRYTSGGLPQDLNTLDLLLEGYDARGIVVTLENPEIGAAEPSILKMLSNEDIVFAHIRNAKAGCFIARIERNVTAA